MAEGKICLDAERSMMFANCHGEVEGMSLCYSWETWDLRSRTVLRMVWRREGRNNGEKDRVLDMARKKRHLNCENSNYSQHRINLAEKLLE